MLLKQINAYNKDICVHLVPVSAGAQSCIELRSFAEGVQWCDEGLKVHPTDKKLQELRATADKHKVQSLMSSRDFGVEVLVPLKHKALFFKQRAAERDARKAKIREKKLHGEKEALLAAITVSIPFKLKLVFS